MEQEKKYQYIKIKDYILNNIQAEVYKSGKIESENQLAKLFHVSRMTVRQALASLLQDNVVYTIPKKGIYVKEKTSFKELGGLQSFSEDVSLLDGKTSSRIIICCKERTDNEKLQSLKLLNDCGEVWHVVRVRYLDNKPIVYENSYYNGKLILDIPCTVLQASLYAYFEQQLQLNIDYSHQQIDACLAQDLSKELEVEKNTPLLRILQTTYLNDGTCLEYGYNYYRVDQYSFNQNAYRRK